MESYDSLFKEIEEYSHMTVDYLTHSKIGKVMKRIAALEGIPRDEDLKIKDRASNLMGVVSASVVANVSLTSVFTDCSVLSFYSGKKYLTAVARLPGLVPSHRRRRQSMDRPRRPSRSPF